MATPRSASEASHARWRHDRARAQRGSRSSSGSVTEWWSWRRRAPRAKRPMRGGVMTTTLEREVAVTPNRLGTAVAMLLAPWGFVVANACYALATRNGGSDETGADSLALTAAHPTLLRVGATAAMLGCLLV